MLRRVGLVILAILILVSAVALALVARPYVRQLMPGAPGLGGRIAVHFIDVGDADSTLIVCDGHAMLVDGGDIGSGNAVYDYVKRQGVTKLDYMVGTHPHADHMGGLSEVLLKLPAERFLCCFSESKLGVFHHFERQVRKKGKQIEAPKVGDTFPLGGATFTVLNPGKGHAALNNMSLVLRFQYGDATLLIEGDAQIEAELDMIGAGLAQPADILRIGHHGSNDATAAEYLQKTKPKYAVISCGPSDFGHPQPRLLARLKKAKARVYRTDQQGTITATSNGRGWTFSTEK